MNHNFKEIKETYNYVYAIINSDVIGRKFLKISIIKLNKLSHFENIKLKSEEKIRNSYINEHNNDEIS